MSKQESYHEIEKRGLSIKPVIIWFERSDLTSSSLLNRHANHAEPEFDDIILDAYLLRDGSEEVYPSPIKYAKYGVVLDKNGKEVSYEMTLTARQQLKHLTDICHNQWSEIKQIHLEGVYDILKNAVISEYQKLRQDFVYLSYDDEFVENPPVYRRNIKKTFIIEAEYDPTRYEEYKITYLWRSSRFPSLQHMFMEVMIDYDLLRMLV